jgi:hypothetical protein
MIVNRIMRESVTTRAKPLDRGQWACGFMISIQTGWRLALHKAQNRQSDPTTKSAGWEITTRRWLVERNQSFRGVFLRRESRCTEYHLRVSTVVSRKRFIHTGMGFMQVSQTTARAALRKHDAWKAPPPDKKAGSFATPGLAVW